MRDVHGHIHFGADFLGNDYKAWENFFTICNECEEIFYKMCNRQGQMLREGALQYAQPNNDVISYIFKNGQVSIKTQDDLDVIIEAMQDTRNRGINFCNIEEEGINTIEFRMPNGTLDINTIRENIRLFAQLLNVSKQMSINASYKTDIFLRLKSHSLTEREKVESLLDLLFDDNQEKGIYRQRWDAVKDYHLFEQLKAKIPTFERGSYSIKKGNYSMREQTAGMFRETKAEDRANFVQMVKATIEKMKNRIFRNKLQR